MNPLVFIVGCARSGTTLLHRILDAHSWIAVSPEMHWLTRALESAAAPAGAGVVTSEMLQGVVEHSRWQQFGIGRERFMGLLEPGGSASYERFLGGLFGLYAEVRGKPLVGNKTPDYVRNISALHLLWPTAKFAHLIRDGRDVCLSMLSWKKAAGSVGRFATWSEDPVATTALWWTRKVRLGREGGRALRPDLYHEMRYESLVERPEEECARLCQFLAVPYEEAMLGYHQGRTRSNQRLKPKAARLPVTPGLRDWRSQMPAEDVERFEAAAGNLLNDLGYPRAVPHPGPEARRHAARIRKLFIRDARSQGRRLPEHWHADAGAP